MAEETQMLALKSDPLGLYLNSPDKPAYYANGFQAGITASEFFIIFTQNNAQKVALTLPMPAVKSLQILLDKILADYEAKFDQKLMSLEDLNEIQKKYAKK